VIRPNPRLRRISIAAFILILAAGPVLADPVPAPPPRPSGPQPMPYPDVPEGGEVRAHKHIGNVKYEDVATASLELDVEALAWGRPGHPPVLNSADPMEGGQVTARTYRPGRPTYGNVTIDAQARTTSAEPGKVEVPNMVAEPLARGTATFKTLAGACATGKHLTKVKIVTRTGSYTVHDAMVTSVTPAGDGMDEVSLTYDSVGD
jgi:hypothetical protein